MVNKKATKRMTATEEDQSTKTKSRRVIALHPDTYAKITKVEINYRQHHPEYDGHRLSKSFIINKALDYYLEHP